MIKPEQLQEGWVKFSRFNCAKGEIDIWSGDCADNPNRSEKSNWNLNTFVTFIRLNKEGEWRQCRNGVRGFASEMAEKSTSNEIWNQIDKDPGSLEKD